MVLRLLMICITSLKNDSGEKSLNPSYRTLIMVWISVLFSKDALGAAGVNGGSQHMGQGPRCLPSCTVLKITLLIWMAFKSWIQFSSHHRPHYSLMLYLFFMFLLAVECPWVCDPKSKPQRSGSQSVASITGNLLETQFIRLHSRYTESGTLREGPSKLF